MTTTTDTTAARIAEIEARVADDEFTGYGCEDVPFLLAELKAAREIISWYADQDNYDSNEWSLDTGVPGHLRCFHDFEYGEECEWEPDNGKRARAYLNRGAE